MLIAVLLTASSMLILGSSAWCAFHERKKRTGKKVGIIFKEFVFAVEFLYLWYFVDSKTINPICCIEDCS